jgi:hypothetical protein
MTDSHTGDPSPNPTLLYRLADSTVLIGVQQTEAGPQPLLTQVGGEPCAVAYTNPEELRRDLPEGYRMYQLTVPELLAELPPVCGLVVNPRAPSPVYVSADRREAVIEAGRPFPAGATIRVLPGGDEQPRLLAAALGDLKAIPALRRLYCTRYRVADAREKLLVVYDTDAEPGADVATAEAVISAATETRLVDPLQVIALDDVPDQFREVVLGEVPPAYVRADLSAGLSERGD